MRAKDIMSTNVATIRGSATVEEAVKVLRLKGLRALIVEPRSENDAYGILTETDIAANVVAYGKDPKQVRVCEIMSKPCIVVNPDLEVEYIARLFANANIWRAPVIQGELLGIVSVTDIIRKGDFVEKPKVIYLQKELEKAILEARTISQKSGITSQAAIDAWEVVEALEAEAYYYGAPKPEKDAREEFSEEIRPQIKEMLAIGK
jgi:CBS domain-containing protein